jgi:hypothetical protein
MLTVKHSGTGARITHSEKQVSDQIQLNSRRISHVNSEK